MIQEKVDLRVKEFMYRLGNQISFHVPHCLNYRLFVVSADMKDNPFAVKIEPIDSVMLNEPFEVANDDVDSLSAHSARATDKSHEQLSTVRDKENCAWVNDLLAVLFEAWTSAKVFHDLVLSSIYNAVNDGRDDSLGEIKLKALQLEGKPPRLIWVRNASVKKEGTNLPCFKVEGDAVVPGKIKILIETSYKINWPAYNWTSIDLELLIVVSNIKGRLRFQYSSDVEHHGGSYLQFLGRPTVTV